MASSLIYNLFYKPLLCVTQYQFLCGQDLLETVFEDGALIKEYTFAQVRENAEIPLVKEAKAKTNGPDKQS